MKLKRRIKGFANKTILSAIGLTSVAGLTYVSQEQQVDSYAVTANAVVNNVNDIYAASLRCHYDMSRWCTPAELTAGNYYTNSFTSPMGTNINITTSGDDLVITIDSLKEELAARIANGLPSSSISGAFVNTRIKRPSQSEIFSERLARYQNTERPEATQLETSIDFNGNDLTNVELLGVENLDVENLTLLNIHTEQVDVSGGITLGANAITHDASGINLNANSTTLTGDLIAQSNIVGSNSDINGINQIEANQLDVQSLITDTFNGATGTITNLSGDSITFATAQIDTTSAEVLESIASDINTLSSVVANTQDLTALNADIDTATITSATVTTLSGQTLSYESGVIQSLQVQNMTSDYGDFNTLNTGSANVGTLVATSGDIDTVNGATLNATTATGASITSVSGQIQNGTASNIDASTVNVTSLDADKYFGGAMDINRTLTVSTLNATGSVNITNLVAGQGVVNGDVNVSNNTDAGEMDVTNGISGNSASINSTKTTQLTTNTLSANTINANNYTGGSYTATGDFTTAQSSVNQNYIGIFDLNSDLDNCVNVTGYCLPQPPVVQLSCPFCINSDAQETFFATVIAEISSCKQGCDYQWALTGVTGTCPSGTIAPTSTATTITCDITQDVPPETILIGEVSLTASNSAKPTLEGYDSNSVNWENTTSAVDINDETSLDCSNCSDSFTNSNYKGAAEAVAYAIVQSSGRLEGVEITVSYGAISKDVEAPDHGSADCWTTAGSQPTLTANVIDGDSATSGSARCTVDFTAVVTSSNASGSATYTGTLTAMAATGGGAI